ncbi:MAG: 50S ribosomal protein L10 [Planctomycetes bacterium]|nr:50S ribosomal protein L10 [Planctomycetota bacterium]
MADKRPKDQRPKGADVPNRINRLLKEEVKTRFSSVTNLVMISNLGLNSEETVEVRNGLGEKGLKLRVVRSRLSMQAFRELGVEDVEKLFDGQTAIIEAEDPVMAAKLAVELVKKFDKKLKIVGGLLEGKALDAKAVKELARSKSKPEQLAEVSGQIQGPGRKLVGVVLGPGRTLAGQIKALVEKKEKEGTAA